MRACVRACVSVCVRVCDAEFDRDHVFDRNRIYILEKYAVES